MSIFMIVTTYTEKIVLLRKYKKCFDWASNLKPCKLVYTRDRNVLSGYSKVSIKHPVLSNNLVCFFSKKTLLNNQVHLRKKIIVLVYLCASLQSLLNVQVWIFGKSLYETTRSISEKINCTVLFTYLLTVPINRPGLDIFKKSL